MSRRLWIFRYESIEQPISQGSNERLPIEVVQLSSLTSNADSAQPRPEAAISLIHKQPVRWTHKRVVECDGGGGPLGHPRIFINVDKPQICMCTYCGLPFVSSFDTLYLSHCTDNSRPTSITESTSNRWRHHILWKLRAMLRRLMSPKELPTRLLDRDRGHGRGVVELQMLYICRIQEVQCKMLQTIKVCP